MDGMLSNLHLTSWAGVVAVTMFCVSILKLVLKEKMSGKEAYASLVIGVLLSVVAKLAGAMTFAPGVGGWIEVVIGGLVVGVSAQVAHDKVWNPLLSKGEWSGPVEVKVADDTAGNTPVKP